MRIDRSNLLFYLSFILPLLALAGILLSVFYVDNQPRKLSSNKVQTLPEVLDWHIRFSSDQQSQRFSCILSLPDTPPQKLMDPLVITVQTTLLTEQILEEAAPRIQFSEVESANVEEISKYIAVVLKLSYDETSLNISEPLEFAARVLSRKVIQPGRYYV